MRAGEQQNKNYNFAIKEKKPKNLEQKLKKRDQELHQRYQLEFHPRYQNHGEVLLKISPPLPHPQKIKNKTLQLFF